MNLTNLKERTTQTNIFKDIRGKEVYPGDMIVIPASNSELAAVMVIAINPKSLKCVTIKSRVFNVFSEFLKITDFYDKSELDKWQNIRDTYFKNKAEQKANYVKEGTIHYFFYDKVLNKCGIAFTEVKSKPGKNFSVADIKESIELLTNYPEKDVYVYTKDNTIELLSDVKPSNICVCTDNTFYWYYKNTEIYPNIFYYAYKSNIRNEYDLKNVTNYMKTGAGFPTYYTWRPRDFFERACKYAFSSDINITKDSVWLFPFIEFSVTGYNKSMIYNDLLFDRLEKNIKNIQQITFTK